MQIPGLYPALLQTQLKAFPAPKEKESSKMQEQHFPWSKSTVVNSNYHMLMCPSSHPS